MTSPTSRLAGKHGFTLGHLHDAGGRELECILERYDMVVAERDALKAELSRERLNGDAILEIRRVCNEIMGGNCAFVDDDFARCLLTMKERAEKAEAEREALRRDAGLLASIRPVLVDSLCILRAMDTTPHYRVSLTTLRKLCNEIVAAMDAIDATSANDVKDEGKHG